MTKRIKNKISMAAAAITAFVVMALSAHAAWAQGAPAALVSVDTVREEPLTQTVPVIGRFVAVNNSLIAARIEGPTEQVFVSVGDRVARGDILVQLDNSTKTSELAVMRGQIAQAKAELRAGAAQLTIREQELDRQTRLQKTGAFSKQLYQTAQQEVLRAKADMLRLEAVIMTRQASEQAILGDIEKSRIRAPFDGMIVQRMTDPGHYLRTGDQVVRLVSDTDLEIEAAVPSSRIPGLTKGLAVSVNLDDGRQVSARVRAMLPVENPLTRTRPVRFVPELGNAKVSYANDQSVTLNLPLGALRQVMTVHKDAIIKKSGEDVVFVVSDGKAMPRKVILGEQAGSRIEVISGLRPGEEAVVRGNERLRPGAKVRVGS